MSISRSKAWQGKVHSPVYFTKPRKSKEALRAELKRAVEDTAKLRDDLKASRLNAKR